ncbi:hypothetical protein GOP47_0003684 [Adiantum capillus-veneris]|uniref:DNA polymerase kappa n=1 Tax=Adiantum capillus-veneris TaxID=13818 RepID=A0A9D4ZP16_ADICA|nr:hypothetical protein GOP47_0003684 [Adiantum capillus-veneris]
MASDRPWHSYHTVFTNAKAGMDGVDKEKVQRVVYEMSKGSKYFENEQRRETMVLQKIQYMQTQVALLTQSDITSHEKVADIKINTFEVERDLSRIWMHVDLDAFYAAVETLEDPTLVGKPMAVGGMSMICTANYEARKFGVRAAMPGFIACKLCPDLTFIRPNFEKYTLYSEKVRQVFRDYDPHFLARSLDEAYLDITEQCSLRNLSSAEIAEELRRRVFDLTGLTCSAGVGPNRLIAKVCSDINKPNGQFIVQNERAAVMAFVSTLPIRKVSGIGKVTERLLREVLSIGVCEDLLKKRGLIAAVFSPISTDFFLSVGLGIGGSDTPLEEARKSLSCERTFSTISSEESLFAKLDELAENVAKDMEREGLQGRTLTLKLKTVKFEVQTRSLTLPMFIHNKEDLLVHASKLLKAELPVSLRLMGLRVSHFQGEASDLNQRTLADFFCTNDKQVCKMSETGKVSPCDIEDDNAQRRSCMQDAALDPSCSERIEVSCSPLLTFVNSDSTPSFDPNTLTRRDHLSNAVGECVHSTFRFGDSSDVQRRRQGLGDCFHHPIDSGCAFDSRLSNEMKWVDDSYCSLCKLEIPPFLDSERQEHMDFHFAQMLQYGHINSGEQEEHSRSSKEESKRHLNPSCKGTPPKRGRLGKAEGNGKHLPIDAFFPK